MKRGFGVGASIPAEWVGPLAGAAEEAGYATFWVNDVPGANGLEQLARAQKSTDSIRLGVGVLPVDRWDADSIVNEFLRLELDPERVALGVGAGQLQSGAIERTSEIAAAVMQRLPVRVLIAALGPRMCRTAGAGAHGVILNWLTAAAAASSAEIAREGAAAVGRPRPEIVAYMRTGAGEASGERLNREAEAYESYPAYARQFQAMGVRAIETTVNGAKTDIDRAFSRFEHLVDELVARAIAADESLGAYRDVLNAAAPDSGD
jgi:alkanesulfonate monooxygenase SsuD/methylene tetrahydromethanopterin reductase-like flavin-dependent oxidoreductase (luciferase family)